MAVTLRVTALAVLSTLLIACSSPAATCSPVSLAPAAAAELPAASARLDFAPQQPCAFSPAFTVTAVFTDTLPGAPPQPRINFVVSHRGEQAFTLSQTRALIPFSAIPQGTHRIRIVAGDVTAHGFAGPSGTGVDTMYLRWRTRDVTVELDATLRPWLTERNVSALASALISTGEP